MPRVEKDGDDPSTPVDPHAHDAQEYRTPTALSKLLAAEMMTSPATSRAQSYSLGNANLAFRDLNNESASLSDHLYTRGLLSGRHSDIAIIAFNHKYKLHRLILDRAPFFAAALSEPWLESTATEVVLQPEESDRNITQTAFELALKHLYGCNITSEIEADPFGLFSAGSWLEMQDLTNASINSILRQMSPENLAPLISVLTAHYYSRPGERILASAKAMLCREGWEMPMKYWDGIPGEIVREIVGGDGFYVRGEWERWVMAKRLLDRRLRQRADECGMVDPNDPNKIQAPDTLGLMSIRFDTPYRKNAMITRGTTPMLQHDKWVSLYTHPDVEPILVLLDEGIHYIHLEFEQLQYIRQARDVFGLPLLPDVVVTNALWLQLELRQRVVNAKESDLELGLSQPVEAPKEAQSVPATSNSKGKRKAPAASDNAGGASQADNEVRSGGWDASGMPRKFWIPSTDCNIVMGGNAEPVITTNPSANPTTSTPRHASRPVSGLEANDVQWATDFTSFPSANADGSNRMQGAGRTAEGAVTTPPPIAWSTFPPFRFAVEFDNPRTMKEKKRTYSRTVFYAGSFWKIYIQKLRSQKNPQLGVYLHRAKERETDGVTFSASSVDERIFTLEQEIIMRTEQRTKIRREVMTRRSAPADNQNAATAADASNALVESDNSANQSSSRRRNASHRAPAVETHVAVDSDSEEDSPTWESDIYGATPPALRSSARVPPNSSSKQTSVQLPKRAPALPPYVDPRPTIKTYFKIYSPSKGGRLLSVYESAPDKFDFSQSWGWRSSTLMLDEMFLATDLRDLSAAAAGSADRSGNANDDGAEAGGNEAPGGEDPVMKDKELKKKLRFMIVIGNL